MARIVSKSEKGFSDARYRNLIGELVKARKHLGLSQEALAVRLGKHQQFVSRYEIGERRLDVAEFVDVACTLKLDPAILIKSIV